MTTAAPPYPPALHFQHHHARYRCLIRWPATTLADAFVNRVVIRLAQQLNHGGMGLEAISARSRLDAFKDMSADQLTRYVKAFLTSGQPLGEDDPTRWAAKDVSGSYAVYGERSWFAHSSIDDMDLETLRLTPQEAAQLERDQGATEIDRLGNKLRSQEKANDSSQRVVYEVCQEDPLGKEEDRLLTVCLTYEQAEQVVKAKGRPSGIFIKAVSAAERHPHLVPMLDQLAEIGRSNEIATHSAPRPN